MDERVFSYNVDATRFAVTNVYAPCDPTLHPTFFDELRHVVSIFPGPSMFIGNFNMVRSSDNKNNANFDTTAAATFNNIINELLL